MKTVDITVIMPAYNAGEFLFESVNSIVQQDFENWELILVDDASTDNTKDIALSFQNPRVKLIELPKNVGNYAARNIGLGQAAGKYIAVLDADDIALKSRLSSQYAYLEEYREIAVMGGGYEIIDASGNSLGIVERTCGYDEIRVKLLADNFMLHSTMLMRRDFVTDHCIFYNENYKYAADYEFVFQCSKYGKIVNCADTLVQYRVNHNGITSTKFIKQQYYASQIRRNIFDCYFCEILTAKDYQIIDLLFSRIFRTDVDISSHDMEELLNRLLHHNRKFNSFIDEELYKLFFQYAAKYMANVLLEQNSEKGGDITSSLNL